MEAKIDKMDGVYCPQNIAYLLNPLNQILVLKGPEFGSNFVELKAFLSYPSNLTSSFSLFAGWSAAAP